MNKIKHTFTKMSGEIKELGKKFPLTLFLIGFVTLLYTLVIDQDFSHEVDDLLEKIYLYCTIWGIGTFFCETKFVKKTNKIIGYTITGIISFIFTPLLTQPDSEQRIWRLAMAYFSVLILMSFYTSIQKANLKFEEYVRNVFRDLFHTTTTYIILNTGVMIVTSIFVQLILDGYYGSLLERFLVLLFGLFYVPSMLYTFSSISKKENGSFIKGLILYVLLPLTIIAMAIIYLYIAKIIWLRDMPKNMIYRILAGIFIVAFPVWNMASNYGENKKFIAKITKILPYLYAPFILLEIYSIGTRIHGFGLTPRRYISCLFIVWQVIALVLTFYRKNEKISHILWYAALLVIICLIGPWNYEMVSNRSQKKIIEKTMPAHVSFEQLSSQEKDYVKGAYHYLTDTTDGETWLPAYLSQEEKAKIEEYSNLEREKYDYPTYISLDCDLVLELEKYSKITYDRGATEEEGLSRAETADNKEVEAIVFLENTQKTIDLTEKVKEIIEQNSFNHPALEEDFRKNNLLKISDTEDFYISHLTFRYYKTTHKIQYLRMEGYILDVKP